MKEKNGVERECGRSLRHWGWQAEPVRDSLRCPNCGQMIYPSAEPGTFDFEAWVPRWDDRELRHIYVEVKSGETRLAFNRLLDSQVTWAEKVRAGEEERVDLWLWLCLGRGIGYRDYPRRSYLAPYALWWEMKRHLDRKSIPHGCEMLDIYELEWVVCGEGLWLLPDDHPARTVYGYCTREADE